MDSIKFHCCKYLFEKLVKPLFFAQCEEFDITVFDFLIFFLLQNEKLEMVKQLFMLRYHMELYDYIDRVCHGPLKGMVLRIVAGELLKATHTLYPNFACISRVNLDRLMQLKHCDGEPSNY